MSEAYVPGVHTWTVADVAAHLGVGESTVYDYHRRAFMPAAARIKGRVLWDPAKVKAWHAGRPHPGVGGRRRNGSTPR